MKKIAFFGDSLTEGNFGVSFFDILQRDLPHHTLLNYGEGGDTIVSLYHRLLREGEVGRFDIIVLWIGVNDVFSRMTCMYRIINKIRQKECSRNKVEFGNYYQATLEKFSLHAGTIIAVEPLLIGEDPKNKWNFQLGELSQVIQKLSSALENVEFVELRGRFFEQLEDRLLSQYLPKSMLQYMRDKATVSTPEQVDQKSAERGLHFTLDGVHSNSEGARMISDILKQKIMKLEGDIHSDEFP
jgi:lysophospholipase L1-like esterase